MLPAYAPYQPGNETEIVLPLNPAAESSTSLSKPEGPPTNEYRASFKTAFSWRRVRRSRVLLTLNQVSVMTKNGIEIADALESVARSCQCQRLASSLRAIHEAVSGGQSLSVAIGVHGVYFPQTLAPMLAAAEAAGDVPDTLDRVCRRMRGELQMRGTIIGAMIYPVILVAASSVVLAALVLGVLPQFSRVFESMGRPVPIYTQALLSLGESCRGYWYIILPSIVGSIVAMFLMRKHSIVRRPLSRFLMYGPLIRDAYRPLQAGRVLRTIASMVHGGVPLLQSVQLSQATTGDSYWQGLLKRIEANLIDGLPANTAMMGVDFLPAETAQLMATAERTGRVSEVLEDIGAFYEEEAERRIKRLVVILEPAIIILMGVMVAAIVMSVMLPLLDMSTVRS